MNDWAHIVLAVGGAVGLATALLTLSKDEWESASPPPDQENLSFAKQKKKRKPSEEFSKEGVKRILAEIMASQEELETFKIELAKDLRNQKHTFEETYRKVARVQLIVGDPLDRHGLTMEDLEALLDRYQGDLEVRAAVGQIMGARVFGNFIRASPRRVEPISIKQIVAAHSFMLKSISCIVDHIDALSNQDAFDVKIATIATQALVSCEVEEKFGVTSEELSAAVLHHQSDLMKNQTFDSLNKKMLLKMDRLMGFHQRGDKEYKLEQEMDDKCLDWERTQTI